LPPLHLPHTPDAHLSTHTTPHDSTMRICGGNMRPPGASSRALGLSVGRWRSVVACALPQHHRHQPLRAAAAPATITTFAASASIAISPSALQQAGVRRDVAVYAASVTNDEAHGGLTTDEVLDRLRASMGVRADGGEVRLGCRCHAPMHLHAAWGAHMKGHRSRTHHTHAAHPLPQMAVTGRGRHLGIGISWSLRWRPDGAFCEEIKGRELKGLSFRWGFDGGESSSCWEVRLVGCVRTRACPRTSVWSRCARASAWCVGPGFSRAVPTHTHTHAHARTHAHAHTPLSAGLERRVPHHRVRRPRGPSRRRMGAHRVLAAGGLLLVAGRLLGGCWEVAGSAEREMTPWSPPVCSPS
jgi:hypothetical protein